MLRSMDSNSPTSVYDDWQNSIINATRHAEAVISSSPVEEDVKMEAFHCAAMARSLHFLLQQKRAAADLRVFVITPVGSCLEMVMHVGATAAALRAAVRSLITTSRGHDTLYFNGLRLQDDKTLGSYGMTNGCRVHFLTFAPSPNA